MHKFITLMSALAVGVIWSVGPAIAADDKTEAQKAADKVETTKEKAAEKVERAEDKAQRKVEKAEDKAEKKAEEATDKTTGTKETLKDKATHAKESMKEKVADMKDKVRGKRDRAAMRGDRMSTTDARAAQEALKTQGFDPGPVDGRVGPRTKAAIMDYQKKNDLPVTGMLDDATMARLNVRSSRATDVPAASPTTMPDAKKQNP